MHARIHPQPLSLLLQPLIPSRTNGPSCNAPGDHFDAQGAGGCSGNCYCDPRTQNPTIGVCNSESTCRGMPCATDNDCPDNFACVNSPTFIFSCGSPQCAITDGCTSTFSGSRRLGRSLGKGLGLSSPRFALLARVRQQERKRKTLPT